MSVITWGDGLIGIFCGGFVLGGPFCQILLQKGLGRRPHIWLSLLWIIGVKAF